jgi:hypothetical protein
MSNITAVLFLVLFIFAVMGVQLFAPVTLYDQSALSEHANFQNFPNAFITLFRCTTGEAWNSIMHDLMHGPTAPIGSEHTADHHGDYWELNTESLPTTINLNSCYVGANPEDDYLAYKLISGLVGRDSATIGCSPGYTVTLIYFILFLVFCSFILLNLFLAVILQGFASSDEENTSVLPPEVLKSLKQVWSEIDRKATYHIRWSRVEQLFRRLDQELRIPGKVSIPPLGLSAAVLKSSYGVELEYEQFDERRLARQLKSEKKGLAVLSLASDDHKQGYIVKYGSKLTLKHLNSKGLMQSHFATACAHEQAVSCSGAGESNDSKAATVKRSSNQNTWIVRAPSIESVQGRTGDAVRNGDSIRLQHAETLRFLTVEDCAAENTVPPNPKAGEHMAVTCTTFNEHVSNEPDDWVLELNGRDEKEVWHTGFQVRLVSNTGNMLHSHERSTQQQSARQVTACVQKSIENLWQVEELLTGHGEPGLRRQELIQFIIALALEDVVHVPHNSRAIDRSFVGGGKPQHSSFDGGCVNFIDVTKKLAKRVHMKNIQRRGMGGRSDDLEFEEIQEQETVVANGSNKKGQSTGDSYKRTGYTWQQRWAVHVMQQRCRIHASTKELLRRQIAKEMDILPWDPNSAVKEMLKVVGEKRNMAKVKTTDTRAARAIDTPEVTQEAVARAVVQNKKAATAATVSTAAPLYSARTAKLIDEEKLAQKSGTPLFSARTAKLMQAESSVAAPQTAALPPLKLPPSGRRAPLSSRGLTPSSGAIVTGRRAAKDREIVQLQQHIADIELAEKTRKIAELQAKLDSLIGPPPQ